MASIHQLDRLRAIGTLMDSKQYSDLIITCNGREFKVHKAIVCPASSVIANACTSQMIEGTTGVIEHAVYDADTVERMISYIYTQDYSTKSNVEILVENLPTGETEAAAAPIVSTNQDLIAHVGVYAIAEYYDLPNLKALAVENFNVTAKSDWQIDGFIEVVKEVNQLIEPTNRPLRDALRAVAIEHIEELAKDNTFMRGLAEMDEAQEFAAELLRQLVRIQTTEREEFRCALKEKEEAHAVVLGQIEELRRQIVAERYQAAAEVEEAKGALEHESSVMETLVDGLLSLGGNDCPNASCDRVVPELRFERKGSKGHRRQGDWVVRCKCGCRLIR